MTLQSTLGRVLHLKPRANKEAGLSDGRPTNITRDVGTAGVDTQQGAHSNSTWSSSHVNARRKSISSISSRGSSDITGRSSGSHSSSSTISNHSSSSSSSSTISNHSSSSSSSIGSARSTKGSGPLTSLDSPRSHTQTPELSQELALVLLPDGSIQLYAPDTEVKDVLSSQGRPTTLCNKALLPLLPSERLEAGALYYAASGSSPSSGSPPTSPCTPPSSCTESPQGRGGSGETGPGGTRKSLSKGSRQYTTASFRGRASFACDSVAAARARQGQWGHLSGTQGGPDPQNRPAAYPAAERAQAQDTSSLSSRPTRQLLSGQEKLKLLEKWQREHAPATTHTGDSARATSGSTSTSTSNPWGLADSGPSVAGATRQARHSMAVSAYEQQRLHTHLRTELSLLENLYGVENGDPGLLGPTPAAYGGHQMLDLPAHVAQLQAELFFLRFVHAHGQGAQEARGFAAQEAQPQWLAGGLPQSALPDSEAPGAPPTQLAQARLRRSMSTGGTAGTGSVRPLLLGDGIGHSEIRNGYHRESLDLPTSARRHSPRAGASQGEAGASRNVGSAMGSIPECSPAVSCVHSWPTAKSTCKR